MSELAPHIEYSDGFLSVTRPEPEDWASKPWYLRPPVEQKEWESRRDAAVEALGEMSGSNVTESEQGTQIHIEVENALSGALRPDSDKDLKLDTFLEHLQVLSPIGFQTGLKEDRVLPLVRAKDPAAIVCERFQAWFNTNELEEDVAMACLSAMAVPFGEQAYVKKKFRHDRFRDGSIKASAGPAYDMVRDLDSGQFSFDKYSHISRWTFIREGKASWATLHIGTSGYNYPSISTPGHQTQHIKIDENKSLYGINTHETVSAQQSLSLILGLASLAHYAAQAEYTCNLEDTIYWQRAHRYPYPEPALSL